MSEMSAATAEWAHKLPPMPCTVGVIKKKEEGDGSENTVVKKWFTATQIRRGDRGRLEAYISDFGTWLPMIERIQYEDTPEMCYRVPYTFPN